MSGLHFFFMKVGAGNCFLGFNDQLGELEDRQGLWVGYRGSIIPAVSRSGELQGPLEDAELCTMARASRPSFQKQVVACVFTDSHLTFWAVTGPLKEMPKSEIGRFARIKYKDLDYLLRDDGGWKKGKKEAKGQPLDVPQFFQGFHWLPAKLVHKIPRHELLAPVDSLRVHRWLNSGTFRPLHPVSGNGLMEGLSWLNNQEDLQNTVGGKAETPYAKLVRIYLEILLGHRQQHLNLFQPTRTPLNLSAKEIRTLASRWINPAQLETVAALLALDLGFTLEVGMGKGQDVVDVKASLGHLSPSKARVAARECLERLFGLGVSLTDAYKHRLIMDGVFWIQCKAQDLDDKVARELKAEETASATVLRGKTPNPDLVLTLLPGGSSEKSSMKGRLHLGTLMEAVLAAKNQEDFPHLHDWLTLYLKQVRQGLCGNRP